jgi:pimeloyl-ACP methyl ester carboxylesterase
MRIRSEILRGLGLSTQKSLHLVGTGALWAAGFRWELRRAGEQKIGLWRKNWADDTRRSERRAYGKTPRRLVVIPGFGDTPLSWVPVLAMLRPVNRRQFDEVVFFDFPGFSGFLSNHPAFPSFDLLLESTFDTLDSLRPTAILGHSLGGWLASSYAIACGKKRRPSKTSQRAYSGPEKLILVDPGGAFEDQERRKEWKDLFRSAMERGFEALRPHVFGREPFWFRFLGSEFTRFLSQAEILDFMNSVDERHLVENELHEIQCPTWILWGELDSMMPASAASVWMKRINGEWNASRQMPSGGVPEGGEPKARAVVIRGAGHSPQLERPAATAALLGQVLSGQQPHPWGARWWKIVE